jgi:Protein of unknown function (DUF2842)
MMRTEPTWRIPVGVLALIAAIAAYAWLVIRFLAPLFDGWHALAQAPVYLVLGVVWIAPLGRYLKWMETGRWR